VTAPVYVCGYETLGRHDVIENLRSMHPAAERLGIGDASTAVIGALERVLLAESAPRSLPLAPLVVSAWCRLPEG
jgi:hypothetical protein